MKGRYPTVKEQLTEVMNMNGLMEWLKDNKIHLSTFMTNEQFNDLLSIAPIDTRFEHIDLNTTH